MNEAEDRRHDVPGRGGVIHDALETMRRAAWKGGYAAGRGSIGDCSDCSDGTEELDAALELIYSSVTGILPVEVESKIRGLDIISDIECLAAERGVNVERSKMPIHIRYTSSGNDKDAHLLCMTAMREIGSLEDFVGKWDKDYTLFLYEAYVNPGDKLLTIRCARDKVTDAEFEAEDHGK